MPYVRKIEEAEKAIADYGLESFMDHHFRLCNGKDEKYLRAVLNNGMLSIKKQIIDRPRYRGARARADVSFGAEELDSIIEKSSGRLGGEKKDKMKITISRDVNAGELLGDGIDRLETVRLYISAYPGTFAAGNIDRGNYAMKRLVDVGGKKVRKDSQSYVLEAKVDNYSTSYEIPFFEKIKGLDEVLHEKWLLAALVASEDLGFEFNEVGPEDAKGFLQVCIVPRVIPEEDLAHVLKSYCTDDGMERIEFTKDDDDGDFLRYRIVPGSKPGQYNMKMKAKNHYRHAFEELLRASGSFIPQGATISRAPREKSEIVWIIDNAFDRLDNWIDEKMFGPLGEGMRSARYDVRTGIYNVREATRNSPVIHPIKMHAEKKRREDEELANYFRSHGIRSNETRSQSCMLQYNRGQCLDNIRKKGE